MIENESAENYLETILVLAGNFLLCALWILRMSLA